MRVILVDDEQLALLSMEKMLNDLEGLEVIGKYMNAIIAIEQIVLTQPDAVFLDIEMPEVNGLDVAAIIQEQSPATEIIFVTAYDQYALDAFNVQAMDYLLKPFSSGRLKKTIELLQKRIKQNIKPPPASKGNMRCMGRLQAQKVGEESVVLRWRTTKIKELFAYLLHNRGQVVSKDILIQLLWPEIEEQKGITNLQTSIYRIRQMMKEQGLEEVLLISYTQFGYVLELNGLLIDAEQWDLDLRDLSPISRQTVADHQRLFAAYTGDYLGEDDYYWAETERQRLKTMWLQHAGGLATYYINNEKEMDALSIYQRVVQHDPMLEEGHLAIMRIYAGLNDSSSVEIQYEHMVSALQQEADMNPSDEVMTWYRDWQTMNKSTYVK
ncbi:MAG TPA: response regulator [Candidatus Paenibacillus intestinavium]|nr:response regulator [Candidatus Paenibacillus intestinavium]